MKILVTNNALIAKYYGSKVKCNATLFFNDEISISKLIVLFGGNSAFYSTFNTGLDDDDNPYKDLFPNTIKNNDYTSYDALLIIKSCKDWGIYRKI